MRVQVSWLIDAQEALAGDGAAQRREVIAQLTGVIAACKLVLALHGFGKEGAMLEQLGEDMGLAEYEACVRRRGLH